MSSFRPAAIPGVDYSLHELQEKAVQLYRETGSESALVEIERYRQDSRVSLSALSQRIRSLEHEMDPKRYHRLMERLAADIHSIDEQSIHQALTLSESPSSMADFIKRRRFDLAETVDGVLSLLKKDPSI